AGIDRGVGLDEVVVRALADRSALGADDPRGDGVVEPERVADGDHPVTDLERVGVAELRDRERVLAVDLQHGEIGLRIAPEDLGRQLAAVAERHGDLLRVLDDVVVRQHDTVLPDDEAGPHGARGLTAAASRPARHAEAAEGTVRPEWTVWPEGSVV